MTKINIWIRRCSVPFMWISGILILAALLYSRMTGQGTVSSVCCLAAYALAGIPVMFRAVQALRLKTVSIELLVSIAAAGACCIGEFSESAAVTFLFQFGSFLEQKTIRKTRSAIKSLTDLAPSTACRIIPAEDGSTADIEEIDADDIEAGDLLLVRTGDQIAADGIVTKGSGHVTEASITGESRPKFKDVGDPLYSGTFLENGTLHMRAVKVGMDTTFSKIISLVEEAQDAKSPAERFIDRFARYYTPAVIAAAALVLLFTRNLDTAITVLVLACPGALVIGAPIANVAGIGCGAQHGILMKGGDSLHTFSGTDTVVFDKTGTLTAGNFEVVSRKDYSDNPALTLALAAGAEQASDHPLARAVIRYAADSHIPEFDSAQTVNGQGVDAIVSGSRVLVGSRTLIEQNGISLPAGVLSDLKDIQHSGATTVLVSVDGRVSLLLGVADELKPDAADSILRLRKMGVSNLVMLTGDNFPTAAAVSGRLGITDFRAELLPDQKLAAIRALQSAGRTVTFVGDGINDSPAIVAADTGIAMGSGTDAAIENSDVVLIGSSLENLADALGLAKKTVRILRENIAIAVGTVVLLLAGLFAGYIHMSAGMLIHEASILAVIINAMRLLVPKRKADGKGGTK